jgi:hypothetical protein
MSILLHTSSPINKLVVKSKRREPKTSSILLISITIFIEIILLMYAGILWTESAMKAYSTCRDNIIGYEQQGFYTSPGDSKLALSFCDSK